MESEMITLKVRDGWTADDDGNCVFFYPTGTNYLDAYAALVPDAYVAVFPNGREKRTYLPALGGVRFNTIQEAHAYLIKIGSESPWEVVK